MIRIKHIAIFSLFFMLCSCAGPYTYKDNGSIIELSEDDTFEVILDGEANSPYFWRLDKTPSFVTVQTPVLKEIKGNMIEYSFSFKTVAQGQEKILLVYSNGEEIKRTFELHVIIGTLGPILSD